MSDNSSIKPVHSREKIRRIIFDHNTPASKGFDIVLLVLIFLAVFATMLESVESIRNQYGDLLRVAEWIFTILFMFEYLWN